MRSLRLGACVIGVFLSGFSWTNSSQGEDKPTGARQFVREIVAHRGLSSDRPENTVISVKRAIEVGATAVEVDVRLTKDDQLVLLHDPTLDRTTNGKGPVRQMTFDEVRKLDAGRWFDAKYAGEKVPTLAEVLVACRGKIDVLLDLKEEGEPFAKMVVAEVKAHGDPQRTIIGVRSVEQAKQFRRLLPGARQIGLIPKPDDLEGFVAVGVPMIRLWPKWLSDESLVERVRQNGAKLHLNTEVGKADEVLPLLNYRPDSMSSDDPAQLIATLSAALPKSYTLPPSNAKIKIVIDTDIGSAVDDAFALGLALASPEFDIRAITTVGSQADDRAWMVCRFLSQIGRRTIPVAAGGQPIRPTNINDQIQYRRHPGVIFNRTTKPSPLSAVDLMYEKLKESPGEITIIALGPLTNIANLFEKHPDCRPWIKRLVIMGGSLRFGYDGRPTPEPEWNIATDIPAARRVFNSGVPIMLVPLDATATVRLYPATLQKIIAPCTPITYQIQSLYELAGDKTPVLFDPVAVTAALPLGEEFLRFENLKLQIDDKGHTRVAADAKDAPTIRTATSIDSEKFLAWYVDRMTKTGKPVLPKPPGNLSTLAEQGGFPAKVHVIEDYETDIEKRWWMAGKGETVNLSPENQRACRAVLTLDFDDLQGDPRAMYRAVIFNPVPGPPMGPNTRLSFKYKLTGTDQLRVQLYSLTNGYHRYLSLKDLPQGQWQSATVDMTKMRRPDGTGGPLAEDERIDDIQFYIDPRAELLIDDIVLYDAQAAGSAASASGSPSSNQNLASPFPKRLVFTAWFDTGKQGKEWPGDFEIVPHVAPQKWKFARSAKDSSNEKPWIVVSLRGPRRLDSQTNLDFRYQFLAARTPGAGDGATTRGITVELRNSKTDWRIAKSLAAIGQQEWTSTSLVFETTAPPGRQDQEIDEIRFLLPKGSELGIDNLLLYTPADLSNEKK